MKRPTDSLTSGARGVLPFVAGWVLLAIMGNTTTALLNGLLAPLTVVAWLKQVVVVALTVGLLWALLHFSGGELVRWLQQLRGTTVLGVRDQPSPAPKAGLIALVSPGQSDTVEKAIAHHAQRLTRLWLIATEDSEGRAREIEARLQAPGLSVRVHKVSDPFDVRATKERVEAIFRTERGDLPEEEVIADFTGGTKPMSAGMIFACLTPTRSLQYVPAEYKDGKPVRALSPVLYSFDEHAVRAGVHE